MTIEHYSIVDQSLTHVLSEMMDIDQMLQFTQALQRMCSYGYGELTIVVKNGRPFALVEKRSIRLKKGLTADS